MTPADDVLLLCIPSVRDLRAISPGSYQLVTFWLYDFPSARLEIQAHVDEVNELYQPAPFRLYFALALHLMYIVLCQLFARRDHSQRHEEGLLCCRSSRV